MKRIKYLLLTCAAAVAFATCSGEMTPGMDDNGNGKPDNRETSGSDEEKPDDGKPSPEECCIEYTTLAEEILVFEKEAFDFPVASHTFEGGHGKIVFESPVSEIRKRAFQSKKLTAVTIPESVRTIGERAFDDNSIDEVIIPGNVSIVGPSSFCGQLSSLTIRSGVDSIADYAFTKNLLKEVFIPGSVRGIGEQAFDDSLLEKVTVGDGVKYIRYGAFQNCSIGELVLPDSVEEIGQFAFADNGIASVDIPAGLKVLENSVFKNNALVYVTLPEGIERVCIFSFYGNRISELKCNAAVPPVLEERAFDPLPERIAVPSASLEAYRTAPVWSTFADRIQAL
jgi:surface antigen bspA-like